MAKKKVFKGTINGVEFNSVADYNKEMTRLINEGKDVNASSQTTIENVEDNCTEDCCTEVRMLPGFDIPNVHYINNYIGEDIDKNMNYVAEQEENFANLYPRIVEKLENMDQAAVEEYYKDATICLERIKADRRDTAQAVANLEHKLQILDNSDELAALYEEIYASILSAINERLGSFQKHQSVSKEMTPYDIYTKYLKDNPDIKENIGKLLKDIFGPNIEL